VGNSLGWVFNLDRVDFELKAQMDAAMDELNKEYEKILSRFKKT
jgi:hypothetical protein